MPRMPTLEKNFGVSWLIDDFVDHFVHYNFIWKFRETLFLQCKFLEFTNTENISLHLTLSSRKAI